MPSAYAGVRDALSWLGGFPRAEFRKHSQNGEDGVIAHTFKLVNASSRYYVEFGVENGMECNTRWLREHGWTGLLMDGQVDNPSINLHRELIDEHSIVNLFRKYNVPKEFDLLSVDVDCKDWWLTRRILHGGFRPRVIVNEVNTHGFLAPPVAQTVGRNQTIYCTQPFMTSYQGASLSAFSGLYKAFGYRMVYCESKGVNCFAVRDDLLQPLLNGGDDAANIVSEMLSDAKLFRPPRFGRARRGHPPDPLKRPWTNVSAARVVGPAGDLLSEHEPDHGAASVEAAMKADDLIHAGMRSPQRLGR
jgi:hypothetical protein